MRTIPQALTWELFSHGRWQLPLMTLAGALLPVLLYSALEATGALAPADSAFIIIHFAMVQIVMFTFGAGLMQALGPISRLYTYPARTSTLVAWQLLPAMALMLLEIMAVSALLNVLYDVRWPLVGPALFAAVAMSALFATMWLTERTAWLPWSVALVAAGLGLWFKSRHGGLQELPTHYWEVITLSEGVTLLLIAAASFAVAVYGVSLHRRGDTLPVWGIKARLDGMAVLRSNDDVRFASPAAAQLWFEWRKKGWALPACVVFALILCSLGWLIFSRDPQDLLEGLYLGGGAMVGIFGLIGGMMLGDCGAHDGGRMSQFLATRPLTNSQLARTMLWNSAKSVATAWLLWVVPLAMTFAALVATDMVPLREIDPFIEESWWWYLPVTFTMAWSVSTCVAALGMVGRQRLQMALLLGGFALLIALNVISHFALSDGEQLVFWHAVFFAVSGSVVSATLALFLFARRRGLIETPVIWVSMAAWCLLIVGLVTIHVCDPRLTLSASLFLGGLSALAVAPFAGTPLALAWNRTR